MPSGHNRRSLREPQDLDPEEKRRREEEEKKREAARMAKACGSAVVVFEPGTRWK